MNRRWWNNEIICTVANKSEIFQFKKKDSVEMFSAYTQEVNLKVKFYNFQFLLLAFLLRAPILHRKFQLQDLCLVVVMSETSSYFTHTSYFLNTSLTTFLFTPLSSHTRHHHEPRKTYVCWVLFQCTDMHYCFQYVFHEGKSRISTWHFFTPSRKE